MTRPEEIRKAVSKNYARAVESSSQSAACSPCCCSSAQPQGIAAALAGYDQQALSSLPADAVINSFGCGNPVALSGIREGDTVLDLGSGAGIDLLLAARLAGPTGNVIGVDMTLAMIERARANIAAAGFTNIEVRQGIIEELPVDDESIDFVISNCVINLSPEKPRVFAQLSRVLKHGGRFSISDMVSEPLPKWLQEMSLLYSSCISGAIPEEQYLAGLRNAGLIDVHVKDRLVYEAAQLSALLDSELAGSCCAGSTALPKEELTRITEALAGKVSSIKVVGRKP